MSSMVERVARAIAESNEVWGDDLVKARAAIAAMREPTEAMVNAGSHLYVAGTARGELDYEAETVWKAMIDAADAGNRNPG